VIVHATHLPRSIVASAATVPDRQKSVAAA
jgi:hypothetical protein